MFGLLTRPAAPLTLAAALLAAAAFAQQPQTGQLDANRSMFTVMAALDAAGYDAEWNSTTNHPLRKLVRDRVLAKKPPSLASLKNFFEQQKSFEAIEIGPYISLALLLDGPPDFKFRLAPGELPPDAKRLDVFRELLAKFDDEAELETLWREAQPAIDQALQRYQAPVTEAVFQANAYLRNVTSGFRGKRFQLYLELQGPPNQVQTRTYVDDYIVVVTPSPEPQIDDIRRAYLHYLIDPLMMRYGAELETKKALADFADAAPILDDAYKNDFVLLSGMSLVRAVEARLAPAKQRQAMVDLAMSEGFILTGYFAESLPTYEKDERSMRFYLADLIKNINLAKEDKRLAGVKFATVRTSKKIKPAAAPPPPELTGIDKDLDDAERFYEARNFDAAQTAFRKVLASDSVRPAQAKAYYGLARIAALNKDPELSEKLFEKTLELEPAPVVRAWTHIYLARLALAAQEPDLTRALEHFKAALAVEGGSEKAREMAQKELEALSARKD